MISRLEEMDGNVTGEMVELNSATSKEAHIGKRV
jgi:hypothetical protein